jgi:hypothetical protein
MNKEAMKEVLNELFSHLERLETQNEAILQFLKEKKRVTDKQLAPYLEQAGNASSVKWRAARVRIDHLLEPEHPEKEVKLGKKPELHEAPLAASSAGSTEGKCSEPADQKAKPSELGDLLSGDSDQRSKDKSESDEVKAEIKTEKPEVKSESATASKEVATQGKGSETSDAQPPSEQQRAEPAAQIKSDKTNSEKEAA